MNDVIPFFDAFSAQINIARNWEKAFGINRIAIQADILQSYKEVGICWIGMNSVILPGVVLGDSTIVGAGSVVTKSFVEGRQVIVGSPARVVKKL